MNEPATNKPYRFCLTRYREHINHGPLSQRETSVIAYHISKPPDDRKDQAFVILEVDCFYMHATIYRAHFYTSEETIVAAFIRGIIEDCTWELEPPEKPAGESRLGMIERIVKEARMESSYAGHNGYHSGFALNNPRKWDMPWFLAREGEEIDGNIIVQRTA